MEYEELLKQLATCCGRESGCYGCPYDGRTERGGKTGCLDTLLENAANAIKDLGERLHRQTDTSKVLYGLVNDAQATAQGCLATAKQSQEITKSAISLLEKVGKL